MYFDPEAPSNQEIDGFREWAIHQGICRDITERDPEFRAVKMFCFADAEMIRNMEVRTSAAGMPYTGIERRSEVWEVIPSTVSKGTGIDVLRNKLGVSKEHCYAFGDSENDRSMFSHVGHSIAMGNSPDDIKSVCSYVTDRPEDHGIAKGKKMIQRMNFERFWIGWS